MRVLVAADAMAGLDPRGASEVIAQAFVDAGAQVAVVPLADGGPFFAATVAGFDADAAVSGPGTLADAAAVLTDSSPPRYVDLTGIAHYSWEELVHVMPGDLEELRNASHLSDTVAVVRSGSQLDTLTGLTGVVAERGRRDGADLAQTLADDGLVSAWCATLGLDGATPGSGAAEGLGALVLALGGSIASGIDVSIKGFDLASTMAKSDVVVTGSALLDFHAVGGDVVKEVATLAGDALRPVIAIVGRNFVSSRELRLAGIESAHPILEGVGSDEPIPAQLAEVAAKVARSWSW
ncbi:MAG: glycerate kinase [Propionibacteriaceae bacterium]|nr:glycerate kinase [Propionibacteriaceae bacterium]